MVTYVCGHMTIIIVLSCDCRFDRLVYLDVSEDAELKEKILRALTRKLTLEENFDYSDLAKRCPSHTTGADLYALCSSATIGALCREIEMLEEKGKVIKPAHMYYQLYLLMTCIIMCTPYNRTVR